MKKQVTIITIFTIFLLLPNSLAYGLEAIAPPPIAKAEITNSDPMALAAAMDIEPADLVQATLGSSDPRGAGLADAPFSFFPRHGESFAVFSNGLATMADDPDTNNEEVFQGRDVADDVSNSLDGLDNSDGLDLVQLTLVLKPPPTATSLSFDFAFYSEEFPDWIGFEFNDVFVAELGAEPFTSQLFVDGADISAPTNIAFDPNGDFVSVNAAFGFDPNDLNPDTDTTYDGTSGLLRATGCLSEELPTGNVVLILSITDVGDSLLDSAVFVDNFQWGNPQQCHSGAEQNDSITVIKEAEGASAEEQFSFTGDLADFTLAAGESLSFNDLSAGTYRLIEHDLPKHWALLSVRCNDEFVDVQEFTDPPGRGVAVTLEAGQAIECIFQNERSTYEEEPAETLLYLPLILK